MTRSLHYAMHAADYVFSVVVAVMSQKVHFPSRHSINLSSGGVPILPTLGNVAMETET